MAEPSDVSTLITQDGKTLYRAEVEERRYGVVWVLADEYEDAKEDADILGTQLNDNDWDDIETDISVARATRAPKDGTPVWSGGENGQDVPWRR